MPSSERSRVVRASSRITATACGETAAKLAATAHIPTPAFDWHDVTVYNAIVDRFENGVAYLHMRGSCAGCPSSAVTLKRGVENLIRHYVPEVESVEAV